MYGLRNDRVRIAYERRDWETIRHYWDEYRPNFHGIQVPVIAPNIKEKIHEEARKDGVELPA
jgi:hypothetical protein